MSFDGIKSFKPYLNEEVFNSIPFALSSDYVEIMSISDDMAILMIRDVGHALSIEIEKENDRLFVRYFIPKICIIGPIFYLCLLNCNNFNRYKKYLMV